MTTTDEQAARSQHIANIFHLPDVSDVSRDWLLQFDKKGAYISIELHARVSSDQANDLITATTCQPESVEASVQRFQAHALPSLQMRPDFMAHREIAFRAGWNAAKGVER